MDDFLFFESPASGLKMILVLGVSTFPLLVTTRNVFFLRLGDPHKPLFITIIKGRPPKIVHLIFLVMFTWHIDPVIALFPNVRPFELSLVGFYMWAPLEV